MVIGVGIITFRIHECHSLKEKRRIVKAIITAMQKHFNTSVAEIGANDIHQRAEIGFAMVGNDRTVINSKIDKAFNLAEEMGVAEVMDTQMEIISL